MERTRNLVEKYKLNVNALPQSFSACIRWFEKTGNEKHLEKANACMVVANEIGIKATSTIKMANKMKEVLARLDRKEDGITITKGELIAEMNECLEDKQFPNLRRLEECLELGSNYSIIDEETIDEYRGLYKRASDAIVEAVKEDYRIRTEFKNARYCLVELKEQEKEELAERFIELDEHEVEEREKKERIKNTWDTVAEIGGMVVAGLLGITTSLYMVVMM